jgi:hypothetical protein
VTPPPLIGGFSQRASGPDPSKIEDIYFTLNQTNFYGKVTAVFLTVFAAFRAE